MKTEMELFLNKLLGMTINCHPKYLNTEDFEKQYPELRVKAEGFNNYLIFSTAHDRLDFLNKGFQMLKVAIEENYASLMQVIKFTLIKDKLYPFLVFKDKEPIRIFLQKWTESRKDIMTASEMTKCFDKREVISIQALKEDFKFFPSASDCCKYGILFSQTGKDKKTLIPIGREIFLHLISLKEADLVRFDPGHKERGFLLWFKDEYIMHAFKQAISVAELNLRDRKEERSYSYCIPALMSES